MSRAKKIRKRKMFAKKLKQYHTKYGGSRFTRKKLEKAAKKLRID